MNEHDMDIHRDTDRTNEADDDHAFGPFEMGAAFGLGFEMGRDEYEFRGYPQEEEGEEEDPIERIPLSDRHINRGQRKTRPFLRWLSDVRAGRKTMADEIEYTPEETWKILQQEGADEEWQS